MPKYVANKIKIAVKITNVSKLSKKNTIITSKDLIRILFHNSYKTTFTILSSTFEINFILPMLKISKKLKISVKISKFSNNSKTEC